MKLTVRNYKVVDVFTGKAMMGNPVAVVMDSEGLDTNAMQSIARWTNLSETTFILPPRSAQADYRLRIFTPQSELPFAGHPTLGSAFAALESGLIVPRADRLVQECGMGLVNLNVQNELGSLSLSFRLPTPKVTRLSGADIEELETILGHAVSRATPPVIVGVGAVWVVALLPSVEVLLKLRPNYSLSAEFERRLGATGLTVFARYDHGHTALEVRSFAPSCGVNEDPACGSGNGSVAAFLREYQMMNEVGSRYFAGQGQCVGRKGQISVTVDSDEILIGGQCVTCINGTLSV